MDQVATYSRRAFLGGIGKAALVGGIAGTGLLGSSGSLVHGPARALAAPDAGRAMTGKPLVWVWKFSADGSVDQIKQTLQTNGLGIILKTHDGNEWMTRFDKSPDAVVSPQQVTALANNFEQAGIPFHAWCVVQGIDPIAEAQMCSQVLDAGARSIYFDLEPEQDGNYWRGPWDNANRFGEELRRLQPNAWLVTAPDARPWQGPAVPLAEFASFSNAIAPQAYWATFQGPANQRHFAETGFPVGPDGVTPEFLADVCKRTFQPFNLPVQPIGQGASDGAMWQRFISALDAGGMQPVSLWRYGTADPSAYPVLKQVSDRSAPIALANPAAQPSQPETLAATQPAAAPQPQPYGPAPPEQHITPPSGAWDSPNVVAADANSSTTASTALTGRPASTASKTQPVNDPQPGASPSGALQQMPRMQASVRQRTGTSFGSILEKIIGR